MSMVQIFRRKWQKLSGDNFSVPVWPTRYVNMLSEISSYCLPFVSRQCNPSKILGGDLAQDIGDPAKWEWH
jgi:hypothetical protein